jgi:hypothetical protein
LFNQLHDNKREKQIKQQEHQVKLMAKAYEKLEKQMKSLYSISTIQHANAEAQKNIDDQIAGYERMIELEEEKKKTDKEKIKEWREEIEKLEEQQAELEKERVRAVGGFGGDEDYKDASTAFVEAWLDAFQETGNGLNGLKGKFKEFFVDTVKKQLLGKGVESVMSGFYEEWNEMLGDGEWDDKDAAKASSLMDEYSVRLNDFLTSATSALGIADELSGKGELGTLQKGIQGVTEDTADILASYINSIRFSVSEHGEYIKDITANIGNIDTPNTMIGQLKIVADNSRAIHELLSGVTMGGHSEGGFGIKVFTN